MSSWSRRAWAGSSASNVMVTLEGYAVAFGKMRDDVAPNGCLDCKDRGGCTSARDAIS